LATFFALILITAPVCGLRPLRAALFGYRESTETYQCNFTTTFEGFGDCADTNESSVAFACVLVRPASSASFAINSALFIKRNLIDLYETNLDAFYIKQKFISSGFPL
jgi:hypothetical protein